METVHANKLLIRPEDADHPKLDRLRRAVAVEVGAADDFTCPWVVWGSGLSKSWLIPMLDSGAQVLIMPPLNSSSVAGLPPARELNAPHADLELQGQLFAVSAFAAIDPSPAWQEHGMFASEKLAWLVSHELFVGSGRVWLSTAEVLVTSPSTRPSESRRILTAIVSYLSTFCRAIVRSKSVTAMADTGLSGEPVFSTEDVPYLLAVAGLPAAFTSKMAAEFLSRRLGVEPDLRHLENILIHPMVKSEMANTVGSRLLIAELIDSLGFRSFRLELEERCHE